MKRFTFFCIITVLLLSGATSFAQKTEYGRDLGDRTKNFERADGLRNRTLDKANRKDEKYQRQFAKANDKYERDLFQLKKKYNRKQHQLASKFTKAGVAPGELEQALQNLKADYEADQLALRHRFERARDKRQASWEAKRAKLSFR